MTLSFALLSSACLASFPAWRPESTREAGPYDVWSAEEELSFRSARRDVELGRLRLAREALARLAADRPSNIVVGAWLQEIELRLAFEDAAGAEEPVPAEEVLERLRERYRREAEDDPDVTRLVLAARVETDQFAAIALLERALTADPECAWAHYGMAYVQAQQQEWNSVRRSLERALAIEPGHMWARRLEAWMLARTGKTEDAIEALDQWLDWAEDDARVLPDWLREARLDLALLYTLDGRPSATRKLLEEVGDADQDPVRRYSLEAAAQEALGKPQEALAAAARAHQLAPGEYLPLVQQALLYETRLDDPDRARRVWEKVLELAEQGQDLSAIVQRARANVHLERLASGAGRR